MVRCVVKSLLPCFSIFARTSCIDSNDGLSLLVCGRRVSCLQRSCGYARHSHRRGSTDRSTVTRRPMSKEREPHSPGLATFESPECLTCHEKGGRSCSELVRGGGSTSKIMREERGLSSSLHGLDFISGSNNSGVFSSCPTTAFCSFHQQPVGRLTRYL